MSDGHPVRCHVKKQVCNGQTLQKELIATENGARQLRGQAYWVFVPYSKICMHHPFSIVSYIT